MGDRLKGLAKGGWHPKGKGEGGKESWRGDFKGVNTVAGWMGKGGKSPTEAAQDHQSTPLSALRDPDSFGPPPKHIHYHGAEAAAASGSASGGRGTPVPYDADSAKARLQAKKEAQARAEAEANKPPPGPYRADTTGLSTAHLPKPPVFRPSQGTPPPPPSPARKPSSNGPPRLPPRLPPRQNSHPDAHSQAPPPPYTPQDSGGPSEGILNQGALNRLGKAGIAVPGLDIGGRTPSPPVPPRRTASPSIPPTLSPTVSSNRGPQLGELQSRFAQMSTNSNDRQSPTTGTSWADKQAALKTASNLRDDPSKVSLSDLKGATSTANNFRERHGEQAAAGWRAASGFSQNLGNVDRANSHGASPPPTPQFPQLAGGIKKKPPPPPPKKRNLSSSTIQSPPPPPVPLGSKPKF